jgi:hypothetical protein
MEVAIPLLALGGLYVISNQDKKEAKENFNTYNSLPNTNIPNRNYPSEYPVQSADLDRTGKLDHDNRYDGTAYTDKFFNTNSPGNLANKERGGAGGDMPPLKGSEQFMSLTGQPVTSDYYSHNNMVPFFGSKIRSRKFEPNANETILDNYLGTGSQTIEKTERAPLFAPSENYQWAYGAPNQNDFMQSRVNPSMRMANVKPFAEERVAPGLDLGYTVDGAGGFNSGLMAREKWLDRGVDELRVANHQKAGGIGLLGHEGPAISFMPVISDSTAIGNVEKNRVDRIYENTQDRWFTTTGLEKGQTYRSENVERTVHRPETSVDYGGIARGEVNASYMEGEYMPSKHIDLDQYPLSVANSIGKGGPTEADFGMKSQTAYMNNRTANSQNSYFGSFGGAVGAVVAPLLDVLRPSRKENTIGTLRPYENPGSKVALSYIFNPADRPATTTRETTENAKQHWAPDANQHGGAYKVSPQQQVHTERSSQSDFYYAGISGAGPNAREPRTYDAEYRQRNNSIKSSTIDGRLVQGNMALANNHMNIRNGDKNNMLVNGRAPVPVSYQSPDVNQIGMLQGKSNLYSNVQLDRTMPDTLSQLKGNPYAINFVSNL